MPVAANQRRLDSEGDLDARLLSDRQKNEPDRQNSSGGLRRSRRQAKGLGDMKGEPQSLRQAVLRAKRKKKMEEKGKGSAIKKINAIRKATSALLRSSWMNLITTFGLTLIWIDIHVFLNRVLGEKVFCNLGEEWTDMAKAKMPETGAAKDAKQAIGTTEKTGCGCLNAGCLIIIIVIGVIIALVIKVVESPLDVISELFTFAWDRAKDAILGSD